MNLLPALFLPLSLLSGAGSHQDRHPADCDIYLESGALDALWPAYASTPLARMGADPDMQAALGGLAKQPPANPRAMFMELARSLELSTETSAEIERLARACRGFSFSAHGLVAGLESAQQELAPVRAALEQLDGLSLHLDALDPLPAHLSEIEDLAGKEPVDPWGQSFVYEVHTEASGTQSYVLTCLGADHQRGGTLLARDLHAGDSLAESTIELLTRKASLRLVLEFASEADAQSVAQRLDALLPHAAQTAADAAPSLVRHYSMRPDAPSLQVRGDAQWLTLALGATDLASPLEPSSARASALERLPAPAAGSTMVWQGFTRDFSFGWLVQRFADKSGNAPPAPHGAQAAFRTDIAGGRFTSAVFESTPAPDSVFAHLGNATLEPWLAEVVPAEAVAAYASSLDAKELGQMLFTALGKANGQSAEAWLAGVAAGAGVRLDEAFFDNFGATACIYMLPWKALGLPPVMMCVPLRDPAKFTASLQHLPKLVPGDEPATVRTQVYREVPITTLSSEAWSMSGPVPLALAPSACVIDGRLYVALSISQLKKEIKRLKDGGGAKHALLSGAHALPKDAQSAYFVDWAAILGDAFEMIAGAGKMIGGLAGKGELPVDLSKLPKRDVLAKFLSPAVSRTIAAKGGSLSLGESPLGPEVLPSLAAVVAFASAPMRASLRGEIESASTAPSADAPASADPEAATKAALQSVRGALAVHKIDQKKYPAALADLLQPTPGFPKGFLSSGTLPKDGWERELHYSTDSERTSFRLWSAGANGTDELGGGDDQLVSGGKTASQ